MNRRKSQALRRARRFDSAPEANAPEVNATEVTEPAEVQAPEAPAPEAPAPEARCPDCGKGFASARGVATHKARSHKGA